MAQLYKKVGDFDSVSAIYTKESGTVDQEQDANIALTELDKGLRSVKLGVQCEAVVKFPRLFEKYPFPILINSAFLKLADVFREGNNLLRWCILRVVQQSDKHLDKVLNVDEFVRRIYTVIHSNDSVARALTLRTLGSISVIISERKNAHHSVVNGLDSHDAVEIDAAIFAADQFSAKSKIFAANICSKIAEMIEDIATPVHLKLALIPIMKNMYHDISTTFKARSICLNLLSTFPAQKFVTLTLDTLTHLAERSLVDIHNQIELLMRQLKADPRQAVKLVSLRNLNLLAKRAAQSWQFNSVEELLDFTISCQSSSLKWACIQVLTTLSSSVTFQMFIHKDVTVADMRKVLEVCNICYQTQNAALSSKAVEFFTNVAVSYKKSRSCMIDVEEDIIEGARLAISTQICLSVRSNEQKEKKALQLCLRCLVHLTKAYPNTGEMFVTELVQLMESTTDENCVKLCECLTAIGAINSHQIEKVIPELLGTYQRWTSKIPNQYQFECSSYLATLFFQAAGGENIPLHVRNMILQCLSKSSNSWNSYKLGRQALRYGQHQIAAEIFLNLSKLVASEHNYFWLLALHGVSAAESCIDRSQTNIKKTTTQISEMLVLYQKALISLKASSTPAASMAFQCEFIRLRISLLQTHEQLVHTCNTFKTCPPPAIATALAMSNKQEISRLGHILGQLGKCMKEYETLSEKYGDLYQSSFDSDSDTLYKILLLQQSCEVMKSCILTFIKSSHARYLQFGALTSTDKDPLTLAIQSIQRNLNNIIQNPSSDGLTYQHIDFLCQSVRQLVQTPFTFPRFFFQTLQVTSLKLAVSPQQVSQLDPVLVHHDTHLTVKVEGIVQHGRLRNVFRKVAKVQISVNSELINKTANSTDQKVAQVSNNLSRNVEPHHDYFSVSFLLAFPTAGAHVVHIRADVMDENETLWKTGPTTSLTVKSYDDTAHKKHSSKSVRTSFGQMPPSSSNT